MYHLLLPFTFFSLFPFLRGEGLGFRLRKEEDTCHMKRRIHVSRVSAEEGGGYMSYEEEDTCL
jgi:hypothetical protein